MEEVHEGRAAREESRRLILRAPEPEEVWPWKWLAVAALLVAALASVSTVSLRARRPTQPNLGLSALAHLSAAPAPAMPCVSETLSYPIKGILQNNLAGKGPDKGAEGMRYLLKATAHGDTWRDLAVSISSLGDYTPHSASWNGLHGDFAVINQVPGHSVRLRFNFYDMAEKPLLLGVFHILLCGMDRSEQSLEYIRAFGPHAAYWSQDTQLDLATSASFVEYFPRKGSSTLRYGNWGSELDLGPQNPTYLAELTELQLASCVSLEYRDVDHIDLLLGSMLADNVGDVGDAARSFFFAFSSLRHCDMQIASSSTVTVTSTSSSATATTRTSTTQTMTSWTRTKTGTSTTSAATFSTAKTWTSHTATTTTLTTATVTTTTELIGLPIFASPGDQPWQKLLGRPLRFAAMWLYVGVLLAIALVLVIYWLCTPGPCRCRGRRSAPRTLVRL
ncbi:unnamed protein product [Effrenium voratum]|nr:unnamed protein product [Effrenium voratum]